MRPSFDREPCAPTRPGAKRSPLNPVRFTFMWPGSIHTHGIPPEELDALRTRLKPQ
jgi:hypothetical protein